MDNPEDVRQAMLVPGVCELCGEGGLVFSDSGLCLECDVNLLLGLDDRGPAGVQ